MHIIEKGNQTFAVIDKIVKINTTNDILDLIATTQYNHNCTGIIISKENLCKDFFELKTGLAGEILQKIINYGFKIGIVGDFSVFNSKSLNDFIYECNNGNNILFKNSIDDVLEIF